MSRVPPSYVMLLTRRDRSSLARICAAALSLCCSPFFAAPALSDCPSGGSERVRVTSVEDRLVLRLDDGRLIRLVGLDPPLGRLARPTLRTRRAKNSAKC